MALYPNPRGVFRYPTVERLIGNEIEKKSPPKDGVKLAWVVIAHPFDLLRPGFDKLRIDYAQQSLLSVRIAASLTLLTMTDSLFLVGVR